MVSTEEFLLLPFSEVRRHEQRVCLFYILLLFAHDCVTFVCFVVFAPNTNGHFIIRLLLWPMGVELGAGFDCHNVRAEWEKWLIFMRTGIIMRWAVKPSNVNMMNMFYELGKQSSVSTAFLFLNVSKRPHVKRRM